MIIWKNLGSGYSSNLEKLRKMTPFELLEVQENVTKKELKKAYRKKLKLYHPDTSDTFMKAYCEEVTKLINLAYENLLRIIND